MIEIIPSGGLELSSWMTEDGELTYNGVVYNEMKGAFSSPEGCSGSGCSEYLVPG